MTGYKPVSLRVWVPGIEGKMFGSVALPGKWFEQIEITDAVLYEKIPNFLVHLPNRVFIEGPTRKDGQDDDLKIYPRLFQHVPHIQETWQNNCLIFLEIVEVEFGPT